MISPDITISNHRLRWAVDGMRFTAPLLNTKFYIFTDGSHTHTQAGEGRREGTRTASHNKTTGKRERKPHKQKAGKGSTQQAGRPLRRKSQICWDMQIAKTVQAKKWTSGWHPSVWHVIEKRQGGSWVSRLDTAHFRKWSVNCKLQCLRWWMTARPCIHPLQSEIQRQHQKPKTERQLVRSFTSFQMVHTHAPGPGLLTLRQMRWRRRWKGNGSKVMMRRRWQLLNRDTRRGTQKRTGQGRTPTPTHLAQNGKRKRKSGRTTGQTLTRGGGGRKRLTQPTRREPKPTSAREGPKPDLEREHAWDRGPMGNELIKRCIHKGMHDSW